MAEPVSSAENCSGIFGRAETAGLGPGLAPLPPVMRNLLVLVLLALAAGSADAQVRRDAGDLAALMRRATVVVSPSRVTLATGASEQFSATATGDGDVRWHATGGTITPAGLYTAGSTPGSFVVKAIVGNAVAAVEVIVVAATGGAAAAPAAYVAIHPGESIQRAVDASPAGTAFLIKAGVHRRQTIRPKSGMSFVGEAGAVLDGEHATGQAFIASGTQNVTVRGLRITRYAPPALNAALDGRSSDGWLVEGNEIDNNVNGTQRAYGLRIGNNWIVRGNSIHHNGWVGIEGYQAVGTLIEGNDVYANPAASFTDTVGEAANIKLYGCGRIVIRGNHVHDSPFRGIWIDRSQPDMTIENNRVINHGQVGIWYEVSYRGVVRNNYVENAGYDSYYSSGWLRGGGITVTNSPDVTVTGNTVVNSLNGIIGLQASSYYDGPYGKSELRNLRVQGNTIVMPRGQSGIAENVGSTAVFVSSNNVFSGNAYVLGSNARPFFWMGQSLDERQWQAYGQGTGDTYTR
jgi:parallel beta-helix repeat protein